MEELLPSLPNLTPPLAVAALLGWLLVRFWRQASQDRLAYQQAISELRVEYNAQIREQAARHDAQIADLRGEVTTLRTELGELRIELEQQRRLRWRAEDAAAHYRRQLGLPPAEAEVKPDGW